MTDAPSTPPIAGSGSAERARPRVAGRERIAKSPASENFVRGHRQRRRHAKWSETSVAAAITIPSTTYEPRPQR